MEKAPRYMPSSKTSSLFAALLLFMVVFNLRGATYYSRQTGNWTANSTWSTVSCGGVAAASTPGTTDDVVICAGSTVTFDATSATTIANLTVQAGATLDLNSNKTLNINSLILDGLIIGAGGPKDLVVGNINGCTLSGTGTFSTSNTVDLKLAKDITIPAGSDVKFTGAGLFKLNNNTVTNNGKVEIIEPSNFGNNGTFINNAATSYLYYSTLANFPGITLNATANGNTVEYASSSGAFNMDNTGTYYNLIISGSGTKNLNKATTTTTNFTVTGNLDGNSNNLVVSGNTLVNGTIINTANANTITLSGAGTTVDGTGSISINGQLIFSANHTILSTANLIRGNGDTYINAGVTVTNNGIFTIDGTFTGAAASSSFTNASNSTLKLGNTTSILTLNASASGNTVEFYQASAQNVYTPSSSTFYHLIISGGTGIIKTLLASLTINGNLTISSGTLDASPSNYNITMAGGNWNNSDVFTPRSATVTFNSTGAQSITNSNGETFYNLTVNKTSGALTLINNVTVSNILNMTAGNIDAGTSNKITLGTSTANIGTLTYTAGQIIGRMERWINSTGNYTFPVGTSSYNRKAVTNFTTLTTSGSWIIQFVASGPGNSGLALRDAGQAITDSVRNAYTEGYWDFAPGSTAVAGTYSVTLDATNFTSLSAPTRSHIISRANSSSSYTHPPAGTYVPSATNTRKRSGLTIVTCNLAIGDTTPCVGPITPTITGSNSVCVSQLNSLYYLFLANPTSTFNWSISPASAGTITYNGGDSIRIKWAATGQIAVVMVSETNSCMTGIAKTLTVTIAPLPPGSVSGKINVAENTSGVIYNVPRVSGYVYSWTVTGGTFTNNASPRDTATINWGSATTGSVCANATNGCGTSVSTCISVNVYKTINSVQSGDWDAPTTWDCNCNPENVTLPSRNIRIMAGHTVKLKTNYNPGSNAATNHFIINSAGVLNENNKDMRIDGDFTLNGKDTSYVASNKTFYLNGSNSTVDGTGIYKSSSLLYITGGDKTILAGTNINKTSTTETKINVANITVTNNGAITLAGDLQGINSTNAVWTNGANSTLKVAGSLVAVPCYLIATASGNTVEYNATGNQSIYNTTYYNLTNSGSGVKTVPASSLRVAGNLSITGTAQLDVSNTNNASNIQAVTVGGNWINTSTNADPFLERTGSVTFNGAAAQTISTALAAGETYYNLSIGNTSGDVTLLSKVNTINALTLASGLVNTTSANILVMQNGSTAPALTDASTSYVNGPMKYQKSTIGSTVLNFPIGKSPDCRPVVLTVNHSTNTLYNYQGELFNGDAGAVFTSSWPATVDTLSGVHYWTIDRTDGAGASQPSANLVGNQVITLYFGANDYVYQGTKVTIVKNTAATPNDGYDIGGNCSFLTNNATPQAGNITSTSSPSTFTSFSTFTLGSLLNGWNSLPVELLSFTASQSKNKVDLKWTTQSEINNKYFTIERSADGQNFKELTTVNSKAPNGNSIAKIDYVTSDNDPLHGASYYRLKQTDHNGKFKYFNIVSVNFNKMNNVTFTVFPNPSNGEGLSLNLSNEITGKEVLVVLHDIFGNELYSKLVVAETSGNNVIAIDPSQKLSKGVYIIIATSDNSIYKQKLIIE